MKVPHLFKTETGASQQKIFSAEAGTRASVFYEWDDSSADILFHAKKDSELECVFVQNLALDSKFSSRIQITADEGAKVKCTLVHQGGEHAAMTVDSHCAGKDSEILIQALVHAKQNQKHELVSKSRHSVPHTMSDLKVWCVADDDSQTIFNGVIHIEPGAHHTQAFQKNRNLMLSDHAVIDSIPQLFISNDDVKCSHGSSTSSLDPDQYIYLQSRGINQDQAEQMITRGFMESAVSWIKNSDTRARVMKVLNIEEDLYE